MILIKYTSIFIYLYSGSFKLYHVFLLLFGFSLFYIFFLKYIFQSKYKFKNLLILIFVVLSLDQSIKVFNSIKNPISNNENIKLNFGFSNLFYNPNIIKDNKFLIYLKQYDTPVICDRGWPHVFYGKKSNGFMFDWWFYDNNKKSLKDNIIQKFHKNIYSKTYSNYFIIENGCLNSHFKDHILIDKLLNSSHFIDEFDFFSINYSLRKLNE